MQNSKSLSHHAFDRWCGYAETIAGSKRAKDGLAIIACYLLNRQSARTKAVLAEYRQWLFCQGEEQGAQEDGSPAKRGFSRETIDEVLKAKGKLTRPAYKGTDSLKEKS